MKRAAIVIVVLLAVVIYYAAPWDFWGATKPVLIPPQGDLTLIDTGGPGHYTTDPPGHHTLAAASPEAAFAMSWIREHQTGCHVSLADYAPHTKLSCDTFTLDIQSTVLVLNYARRRGAKGWMQIVRSLSGEEQLFWQNFIVHVERSNQAMRLTTGRRVIRQKDESRALASVG